MPRLATLELLCTVVDDGTERNRWNGDPMASKEASDAFFEAVDAATDKLKELGYQVVRTGHGTLASHETKMEEAK